MDIVQVFNDELQSVLRTKPSISKGKMVQITRAAMKGVKFYKHIVQGVEKFIARCRPEYMIPGLYVIDSIVRQSRHQFGHDRDVYSSRFSRNLGVTFETLFNNCLPDDKPKIVRVLNLWQKNGVFDSLIIQPLLDMASSTNLPMDPKSPVDVVDGNPGNLGHSSKYQPHHRNEVSLKFNKDLLDFDYDEDDDDDGDETPTEAEPPLSSTLGKMKNKPYPCGSPPHEKSLSKKSNQDLVLERWNRIVNKKSTTSDSPNEKHIYNDSRDGRRSRSRSPPASHTQPRVCDVKPQIVESIEQKPKEESNEPLIFQNTSVREAERAAERERRCLPKMRDKHLIVCSSTLWLGHLPKLISEVDISDAFGEFGTIISIDLVPPRGCAYVCMDRRQDAKRALDESRDVKLKGCHIKMAWAPGKGFKEYKKLKDFWESDVGASFIPYSKIDETIDFDVLEEGGVIDEDSMSIELRERREQQTKSKKMKNQIIPQEKHGLPTIPLVNQPPPTSIHQFNIPPPNLNVPLPTLTQGVIPFPPPGVTTSSGGHMTIPPPASLLLNQNVNRPPTSEQESSDNLNSSIDQQLSMTERQISMVEQQLNMIQQAQGIGRAPPLQTIPGLQHPPAFQHMNQTNPIVFDMSMTQHMLHGAQGMMEPSLMMFGGPPLHAMDQSHIMVPTNLTGNPELLGLNNNMTGNHGEF